MLKFASIVLAATFLTSSAHAATIFTDRAAFDAATTGATSRFFPSSSVNSQDRVYSFNNVAFDTSLATDRAILNDGFFNNAVYLAAVSNGSVRISSAMNAIGLYLGSADSRNPFNFNVNGTSGAFTPTPGTTNDGKFIGFLDVSPISVTFNLNNTANNLARELDIVSYVTTSSPIVVPPVAGAVPEPATWAMMIFGFGLVGGAMRRRKSLVTTRVSYAA